MRVRPCGPAGACPSQSGGAQQCAQSLLTHGTDASAKRLLPSALAMEEKWCMLFSEPSAGSDLGCPAADGAARGRPLCRSRAEIWTSLAHKAQIGVLVARTNTSVPKHAGLSQFLIDMNSPGISVRPIIDMSATKTNTTRFLR